MGRCGCVMWVYTFEFVNCSLVVFKSCCRKGLWDIKDGQVYSVLKGRHIKSPALLLDNSTSFYHGCHFSQLGTLLNKKHYSSAPQVSVSLRSYE